MASILKAARDARVVDRLEVEARERARAQLSAAEEEAARLRQAVEAERSEVLRAAALAGLEEGKAHAATALAEVAAAREARLASLEDEVAEVALAVARRILGRVLEERPEWVVELARSGLLAARARREVALRVHPDDAPLLRAETPRLAALLERAPGLAVREDPRVERGGVVVETEAGRVDARVDAQLALLERALGRQAQ
jgi:flagellar biosynthesis/type III secretory pathway protein FliH